jgi:hypothetical protein
MGFVNINSSLDHTFRSIISQTINCCPVIKNKEIHVYIGHNIHKNSLLSIIDSSFYLWLKTIYLFHSNSKTNLYIIDQ